MNERFTELAIQARNEFEKNFSRSNDRNYVEILAELIVRECAGVTLDYKNGDHYAGWCDHAGEILKHFGVEQ